MVQFQAKKIKKSYVAFSRSVMKRSLEMPVADRRTDGTESIGPVSTLPEVQKICKLIQRFWELNKIAKHLKIFEIFEVILGKTTKSIRLNKINIKRKTT